MQKMRDVLPDGRNPRSVGAAPVKVNIPDLFIAVTTPEWMEQKATIVGVFAVAYGAYTHLSPTPFITGAPRLVELLTEDIEELTGGKEQKKT